MRDADRNPSSTESSERSVAEVLKKVRRVEITTRRLVNDVFSGEYHSVFKGQGMEFDEVREYQPGDDIRAIDWNVTARMGAPYIKRFMEERELVVMFLLDVSASGRFGSGNQTKMDTAAEICAVLSFSAIQNHDKVGAIAFTDQIEEFIRPDKGRRHVLHVIREILFYQPRGHRTDVAHALDYLLRVSKRRAIVFVVSDFLSPDFERPLAMAARKHDVVAVWITDPREEQLAGGGLVRVWDQEKQVERVIDVGSARARERYAQHARRREEELKAAFRRNGVDVVRVEAGQDYIVPLSLFFRSRAKRR
ncbi:MAG: DUF58 domain-containing protein [Candidatus Krumholzibacteria bacterium]|nr:DUF58 domain-containing protein [Candidatus Krumholzibacteria bacterium]MDH4337919.1 DUF58 domain-containing protein [Candidatus Krumholzibacteria bacterium]MDH5270335.1 DUF58 domain-containing protein [Candidatus Krumholzibacteria bacterium]MDH5627837.1 DUF58 domain-containing protein [Candidatus Krumholzibacteria bacterium]